MFRKFNLKATVWHKQDLEFEWDPESRAVRGRDAQLVKEVVLDAVKEGSIVSHPYPTSYEIKNPLKNLSEMALVLGQFWKLPEELAKSLPGGQADDEKPVLLDANGKETPIQILH
jgi:hypothetical protein